jgi:hypothetical protein
LEATLPQQGVERNDRQFNADSESEDVIVIVVCTTTTRLDCAKRKKMMHNCSERVTMIVNTNVWGKVGAGWEEQGSQDYQDAGRVFLAPFTLTVLLQINQEGERSAWGQQKLEGVMGVANSY